MDSSSLKKAAGLAATVTQLTLLVVGGLWCGKQLDANVGTEPLGLMVGVFVGFGLGMWMLIRQVSMAGAERRDGTDA